MNRYKILLCCGTNLWYSSHAEFFVHSDLLLSEQYAVIPNMFMKKVEVSKSIDEKSLFIVGFHAEVGDVCKD